jgi:hypothetical protein
MQNGSTLKFSLLHPSTRRWVWLHLLVCLMALNVEMVVDGGYRETFPCHCQQVHDNVRGCAHTDFHSAFLTDSATRPASSVQWFFCSPAETEPIDLEPVVLKINRISAFTTGDAAMMPKASTTIEGISIPLYLNHQSFLC